MSSAKPKALITGINGFVGSHLADLLVSLDYEVHGFVSTPEVDNIEHLLSKLFLHDGDIRDAERVQRVIDDVRPDYLYHLAGCAFVPDADSNPKFVFEVNTLGVLNVLEAVRKLQCPTRILIVSTSEVYGIAIEGQLPINEQQPMHPISYYGMTKTCADFIAHQYVTTFDLDVMRVRPFNHIGPRQSFNFVCSAFAKQIAEIEKGQREPLMKVGNLSPFRDFSDVRDIVKGYRQILERAKKGSVYNIGSHKTVQISDILQMLLSRSRVKEIKIVQDPERMRRHDVPLLFGDTTMMQKELNWHPEISLSQTLDDLLQYWRERV